MLIVTDAFIPYEYEGKKVCFDNITKKHAFNIKRAIRFIEKDNEHLRLRCPLTGEYIDVIGTPEELNWINLELRKKNWYRT